MSTQPDSSVNNYLKKLLSLSTQIIEQQKMAHQITGSLQWLSRVERIVVTHLCNLKMFFVSENLLF